MCDRDARIHKVRLVNRYENGTSATVCLRVPFLFETNNNRRLCTDVTAHIEAFDATLLNDSNPPQTKTLDVFSLYAPSYKERSLFSWRHVVRYIEFANKIHYFILVNVFV